MNKHKLDINDCIAKLVEGYKASLEDDGDFVADEFSEQFGIKCKYDDGNDVLTFKAKDDEIPLEVKELMEDINDEKNELELDDGGLITFDDEDGTIRYVDQFGNTEGVWKVYDSEYDIYKNKWFPNSEIDNDVTLIVNIPYPDNNNWEEKISKLIGDKPFNYNNLGNNSDLHFEVKESKSQKLMEKIGELDFVLGVFLDEMDSQEDQFAMEWATSKLLGRRDEKNGLYPEHEDIAN